MPKTQKINAKNLFVFIILSSLLGGIIGVIITFLIVSPELFLGISTNNNTNTVVEKIYFSENVSLEEKIADLVKEAKESVVYISCVKYTQSFFGVVKSEASGSGFIVSEDGYIVTNEHVISDADNITIVLSDGSEYKAELKGADPLNDVAVLKISPSKKLKPLKMGDSEKLTEGKFVIAIGSPFKLQNSVTLGIISATNRKLETESGFVIERVIQTDAAINPGNSGGPLLDLEGNVIGINTAIISTSGGSEGIGFAIPINTVKDIYQEILESGKVKRPWLGVTTVNINENMVKYWGLQIDYGVLIVDFADYSPAREAGLRETLSTPGKKDFVLGDIIISIEDKKISNNSDLLNVLMKYKPGNTVDVGVYRDNKILHFNVTLGERPEGI